MKCNICGKNNPNDARFCSDCAAPLNVEQDADMEMLEHPGSPSGSDSAAIAPQDSIPSPDGSANWEQNSSAPSSVDRPMSNTDWSATPNPSDVSRQMGSTAAPDAGSGSGYAPVQGYGAFIPEVRQRTVKEHVRNIVITVSVIVGIIVAVFLALQFFKSVGDQLIKDYITAANADDVDKMLKLSVPEDFYEYTEKTFGVDKDGYRQMMMDYYNERQSLFEIHKMVKLITDKETIEYVRDIYARDWGIDPSDIQEMESYEVEVTQYDPGYEPYTNTFQIPVVKYRGNWYLYIWKFTEHETIRNLMKQEKGTE